MSLRPLVIVGTGGLGRMVRDLLGDIDPEGRRWVLAGYLDDDPGRHGSFVGDTEVLGGLEWLKKGTETDVIVAIGEPSARRRVVLGVAAMEATRFATLIHPRSWIGPQSRVGPGSIVYPHATVDGSVTIGSHVILNKGSIIGHDTVIEDYVTVNPGAAIAGSVTVGQGCSVGMNSSIVQGTHVGGWSTIGAGAAVIRDVAPNATVVGVPSREVRRRTDGWHA